MHGWSAERIAQAAGARLVRGAPGSPRHVVIDSRRAGPDALFVGLRGRHVDGGRFAESALGAGAWGVLVTPGAPDAGLGARLEADDPLAALQALATAHRRDLGARVVGITGSTGKTSTKDVLRALLAPLASTWATEQNLNTEIGVPLTLIAAPPGTEVVVVEMAMRGPGQIAELARVAEPDVGVITNIGPVHLEKLGSLEAVAAAKAELIAGLRAGATAVVPAGERLLQPHLRTDLEIVEFGDEPLPQELRLTIAGAQPSAHMLANARAAVAAARAVGREPRGAIDVELSAMRGQRRAAPDGVLVIDDCYNANPMSMRAALDDLAASAPGRRVAVLGDMLELGPGEAGYHREIGDHARAAGVELLVTVGERAREMRGDRAFGDAAAAARAIGALLRPHDTVLIKASRGVGLEVVSEAIVSG